MPAFILQIYIREKNLSTQHQRQCCAVRAMHGIQYIFKFAIEFMRIIRFRRQNESNFSFFFFLLFLSLFCSFFFRVSFALKIPFSTSWIVHFVFALLWLSCAHHSMSMLSTQSIAKQRNRIFTSDLNLHLKHRGSMMGFVYWTY